MLMQHAATMLMQHAARALTRTPQPRLDPAALAVLRTRLEALHARDLANVDAGLYPRELLFDLPLGQFARALPRLLGDMRASMRRKRAGNYKDIPAVDRDRYPAYYRRTFHWQTDGYFSDHSAEIYELGVELLFHGTADVMRRQVVPPITELVQRTVAAGRAPSTLRVLDIACGTGPTLRHLATAHPSLRYTGLDLSPAYLAAARRRLAHVADLSLLAENAEAMPLADASIDAITCVYLFHELPRNARRNVVREMWRVLRPGGVLVIEDSAQLADSGEIAEALHSFPAEFHEPFYEDYLRDDLAPIVAAQGFTVESVEAHMVAKVVVARKPA